MRRSLLSSVALVVTFASPVLAADAPPGDDVHGGASREIIITAPYNRDRAAVLAGTSVLTGESLLREVRTTIRRTPRGRMRFGAREAVAEQHCPQRQARETHAGIGEKGSARDALAMRRKIRFVGVHGCSTDRHKVIVIEEHQHKVAARVRRAGLGDRWLRGNRCD